MAKASRLAGMWRLRIAEALLSRECANLGGRLIANLAGMTLLKLRWVERDQLPLDVASGRIVPGTGVVLAGGVLFLQKPTVDTRKVDQSAGDFLAHSDKLALVRRRRVRNYELEVAAGDSAFPGNHYHFTFDLLPKILMFGESVQGPTLAIPSDALASHSAQMILSTHCREDMLLLSSRVHHEFKSVTFLPSPQLSALNLRRNERASDADYAYDSNSVMQLRQARIRATEGVAGRSAGPRIFLTRASHTRSYNEDEIVSVAHAHGFSTIEPGGMTLADQIATFASADFIVGPSGAAWVNLIHCRSGAHALTWLPEGYEHFSAYSNLATLLNISFRSFSYRNSTSSTRLAALAEYRLDAEVFDKELELLLMLEN